MYVQYVGPLYVIRLSNLTVYIGPINLSEYQWLDVTLNLIY